jgi:hypothetical protein
MPALVAGIHVLLATKEKEDVDARHKAGHDVESASPDTTVSIIRR